MKNFYPLFIFLFLLLCGFSLFKKTDENQALPKSFIQEPVTFSTDKPEEIQKQLAFIAKKYSSQAIEWWILYKKALILKKEDPGIFCVNMHFLSEIQSFPLKDYARLHLYSRCKKEIRVDLSLFPEWLKKRAAQEWYKKAEKHKDETELMESSYHMYRFSTDNYLRERYLITAIELAKQKKDSRLKEWRKELYALSPRYIPHPSHSQKLMVANDLRRARQLKKAAFYYRQLLNSSRSSFHEKNESFKRIRWIYKMRKNEKKYLIATLQWKRWLKRTMKKDRRAFGAYHNISYLLARTQWTLNQSTKALKTLNQIEREIKGKFSLFQVYRMKALIFKEKNQLEKSISLFEKALKEKHPDMETWEKTKWSYAWTLKKAGQKEKSIKILNELLNTTESDYLPSRILFWVGRTYEDMKKQKEATTIYKQLIEKDPLSYYGFLAHYKLGTPIRINKKTPFLKKQNQDEYTIPQWLLSLDETDSALDFLQYKSKQYQEDEDKKTDNWSTLFYYMAKARSYFPLFQMVGRLPVEERKEFFYSYADLMFPMIYTKEVEKAANQVTLEKEIVYALIRQESAWDSKARSPADAFGLMQIRPPVARQVAKRHRIPYKNIYDLYEPEKNILLGTIFLKQLFDKYDSQFIITTAVYNAGRTAVQHWLKNMDLTDPLSFIEEIPYEETRTYVRLLIRNFIFYKLLTSPKRKILFPEWLLHINPPPKKTKNKPNSMYINKKYFFYS